MIYDISPYSFKIAKKLKVIIKPSNKPKYKIDIFKNGELLYSGGSPSYSDYPHYIESHGKAYADERKRLYHIRHKKEIAKTNSRGWWISKLLW
jgi:hypothetical protein